MKTIFSVRFVALATFLVLMSASLMAAEYFVVIGTFADESNARRFTSRVSQIFKDVSYSFNEEKKLYYVHVMRTSRKDEARNWSLYVRNEVGFRDAWVLTYPQAEGLIGNDDFAETPALTNQVETTTPKYQAQTAAPKYQQETTLQNYQQETAVAKYDHETTAPANFQETTSSTHDVHVYASARASKPVANYSPVVTDNAAPATAAWTVHGDIALMKSDTKDNPLLAASPVFTFKVETPNGQALPSEVMLVNFEKVKKIASFNPGEHVAIKASKKNQMVTFVCDVLGYAMETRMFNIDHLSRGRDIVRKNDGVWEVTFKLRKLQVDEVAFMNKTTFFPDAAVLEPSSDVEMNNLLAILQANPGYKIVLHAHCNPHGRREIKFPTGKEYFDVDGAESRTGSDKVLTRLRAETLRNFLVDHGIDKKRIGIVGWGSADPIVSATAKDAYVNDRIELELVAE